MGDLQTLRAGDLVPEPQMQNRVGEKTQCSRQVGLVRWMKALLYEARMSATGAVALVSGRVGRRPGPSSLKEHRGHPRVHLLTELQDPDMM